MSDTPPPQPHRPPAAPRNPLAKFSPAIRAAHERFLASGDVEALDMVVIAVVLDHQPAHMRKSGEVTAPDTARLMADLGFDSLALAEIVFFLEDLYNVGITNEELMGISTVGDLRAFIRAKVAGAGPAA